VNPEDNLVRHVPAGEPIRPWLLLGPFYEDCSESRGNAGLGTPRGDADTDLIKEAVRDARALLANPAREGDEGTYHGQQGRWTLVRRPDKYPLWGRYFVRPHLATAFLSARIAVNEPGVRVWRLVTRSVVLIAINGEIVFDSDAVPAVTASSAPVEYSFEAELSSGENTAMVAMLALGNFGQVGLSLSIADGEVRASIPLRCDVPAPIRQQIEEQAGSIRLPRDLFYPGDSVSLEIGKPPGPSATLTTSLIADETTGTTAGPARTRILREVPATGGGTVCLCPGADLPDGKYRIVCEWSDDLGRAITSVGFDIRKITPTPDLVGYEQMDRRKRMVLEQCALLDADESGSSHDMVWPFLARYALGRYDELDEGLLREACRFVQDLNDTSDFCMQGLLRLMWWEREQPRLSDDARALLRETILGYTYWIDEPNTNSMCMFGENHPLLFHVAEWMAGLLFPLEEFTNSRQRGLFHAEKGRSHILEWFRQRGHFGFEEWHSDAYYPVDVMSLSNVHDFCGRDYTLLRLSRALLDTMFFNLAADSLHGVLASTRGRSYSVQLRCPDLAGTASASWLLFGMGSIVKGAGMMAPTFLATSRYALPKILADIATDERATVESYERQGLLHERPWIRGVTNQPANFCVYRTPDYMVSGLQDDRKGEPEPEVHVGQVTLRRKVVIFWSSPSTSEQGSGARPDYWSGYATMPRVIQAKNVMALTFRLGNWAWMSHCFFEPSRFDEVRFESNWVFGRVLDGYVGIYSEHGMELGTWGQYAGRELVCCAHENTWLVECGRRADNGTFDEFVEALKSAAVTAKNGALVYDSPSIGRFVTGWDVTPTLNGKPASLRDYPLVDSPWAHAEYGSGHMIIRYGDQVYEIWHE